MKLTSSLCCATAAAVIMLQLASPAMGQDESRDSGTADESSWSHSGEARYRYEQTRNIPLRADDISRHRLRIRAGVNYLGLEGFEFGAAAEGLASSDSNRDNRRNKDNERSDDVNLDQLYARWLVNDDFSALFGKSTLPMRISPLLWDQDLRPIGASVSYFRADENGNGASFDAGYFAPDFIFDNEKPRMTALQAGWHWHRGQPTQISALLSYLDFDKLERLPGNGIARTNRRVGVNYLSEYELLDLQLILRTEMMGAPWEFALDGVRNLGADDANRAGRASVVVGDADLGGVELGLAYQRNQRDAVLAIAADDEWWFQSFSRGAMPWVAYGFDEHFKLRLAAFEERRDGFPDNTHRLLLDFSTQW